LSRDRTVGPRQAQLLRLMLLHHGSLSRGGVRRLTRQGRSLAERGLVLRTDSGSVVLTSAGREVAENLWSLSR